MKPLVQVVAALTHVLPFIGERFRERHAVRIRATVHADREAARIHRTKRAIVKAASAVELRRLQSLDGVLVQQRALIGRHHEAEQRSAAEATRQRAWRGWWLGAAGATASAAVVLVFGGVLLTPWVAASMAAASSGALIASRTHAKSADVLDLAAQRERSRRRNAEREWSVLASSLPTSGVPRLLG